MTRTRDFNLSDSFKETEIGPIPMDWDVVPLRDLATEFFSGGTPSTKRPEFWDGNIPWTTSAHIDGLYLDEGAKYITSQGLERSSSKLVPRGNLLIGTRVGVGKVAITSIDIAISQDLTGAIVDKTKAHPEFLAYAIQSDDVQELIRLSSRGTTIKGIPREELVQIPIPLPSLSEQRRIAHVLSTIQRAIAAQDDLIAAAGEVKRSLMQRLLINELGSIPTVSLESVAQIVSGGTPDTKRPEYWNGDIEWVTAKDVSNASGPFITKTERCITKAGLENSAAKMLPASTTILIARGATMGRVRVLSRPMAMNQTCYGLVAKPGNDPLFLYYAMSILKDDMLSIAYGAIFTTVTVPVLRHLQVRFPSLEDQKHIARILGAADRKIEAEEQRKAALQALFKAMLHQLMTGQLRLCKSGGCLQFNPIGGSKSGRQN
jgi:type I restriction enzyme S subunit